jgi:hypothetical protein
MKSLFLRSCAALLCACGLAACGGSSGSLLLSGTITGLTQPNLVLTNGSENLAVAPVSLTPTPQTFSFVNLLNPGDGYNVTVTTQPLESICTVTDGVGNASTGNVTTVLVACVTNPYKLGGTVSGLTSGSVTLQNGNDFVTVSSNIPFAFQNLVAYGAPYGVSVLTQPTSGQTCTVSGGATGFMVTGGVTNIQVTCN